MNRSAIVRPINKALSPTLRTSPNMNESLKEKLRYLRLNRLATHWEDDLKEAARQRMSHATS
jgi:hypothetical protein